MDENIYRVEGGEGKPHRPRRALIVTGEASGDLHGANLIRSARKIDPDLHFYGVGGRRMEDAGCDILIPGEDISVMGLVEVIGHFPVIYRAFSRLKRILQGDDRPDVLVLVDFPDFNLRLAKVATEAGVPVLYYVSPQVWAWRRGRVRKIARVVDHLAVILPFEVDVYKGQDLTVEYVGNPLLDEAEVDCDKETFLPGLGLDPHRPVVGLFPGSRRNEVRFNFDTILETAATLRERVPEVQFLMPLAPSLERRTLEEKIKGRDLPVTLVEANIYNVANACDAVLSVSGTVTLQVALVGTPLVVLYKMAPLTYTIGRRLIKVPFISLVNIVAGEGVVREFIQDAASAQELGDEILRILQDESYRQQIISGLSRVRSRMGEKGCSARVALRASELSRLSGRQIEGI